MSTKKKPRVKIQRPPNAAPNTAFTQLSQESEFGSTKTRIALDPSDLVDDSYDSPSKKEVRGLVIWYYNYPSGTGAEGFPVVSCRSPHYQIRMHDDTPDEEELLLGYTKAELRAMRKRT